MNLRFELLFTLMASRNLHPKAEDGFFRSLGMTEGHGTFNLRFE